mgnify:CR=1 FL=1|jgi:ElaB/YqjD/DUF883 family membrane-anchored ribosome-binding protein
MKNNPSSSTQSPKDLLDDLHALVAQAEEMAGDTLSEHGEDAVNALRSRFQAAQERFSHLYEGAKKQVTVGAKATDEAIRENPYQALAIAAGAGLLLGLLLGRRGD